MSADPFERAFVAVSYLLGRRDALTGGLCAPGVAAERAATIASEPDRMKRAQRLAAELAPIVASLDARRLG